MSEDSCIFCDIARGRTVSHVVSKTRSVVAVADAAPIRPGHLQIVPRAHHACFDQMPPVLAGQLIRLGQDLARALKHLYQVDRVAFVMTGCDTAHAHAHLVPMVAPTDITSARYFEDVDTLTPVPRPLAAASELRNGVAALRAHLNAQETAP